MLYAKHTSQTDNKPDLCGICYKSPQVCCTTLAAIRHDFG